MAYVNGQETSIFRTRCIYDVFLSFRGEDTRKTFTDQLYKALVDAGLRTFIDNNEIERGENIKSELDKAIHQSKGSIIVVSENYASSSWCLDELVMIVQNKRKNGHVILPVFYYVDPSDVGKQKGSFAKAFSKHEEGVIVGGCEESKAWVDRIQRWRAALKEVEDLGGMILQDPDGEYLHETKFIEKIVKVIEERVYRSILNVAPYLIGMDSRTKDIMLWLEGRTDKVTIAGICGMGGIGKTTIAKYVFNLNYENFQGSSFLESIGEFSEYADGLMHLQKQLISDILNGKETEVETVEEGIVQIKAAVYGKRVLVVLDGIEQLHQLDAVLGMRDWFHPGSRIIITTRHSDLLRACDIDKIIVVEKLNKDESSELFSWHAFGQDHPTKDYTEIAKRVVQHCDGLPLALQLLGSSLCGRSMVVWESTLKKLEAIPNSQVSRKLKISYDSLQDDHDKNLFLDIACFFVGKNLNVVCTILEGCNYYVIVGIQSLIDRFLLTIDDDGKVVMHQSVMDMGREIIRQESTKDPGKRTRLWKYSDSLKVLEEKTGTDHIQCLKLQIYAKKNKPPKTFPDAKIAGEYLEEYSRMIREARLAHKRDSSKRRRFGYLPFSRVSFGSTQFDCGSTKIELETDAFSNMKKLRLLQLDNIEFKGSYMLFPRTLKWVCWRQFLHRFIPDDFPLESVVVLEMRHSRLEYIWEGTRVLRFLRILDLSHSADLSRCPNFLEFPNLHELFLKYCTKLTEIDESIGSLKKLVELNLRSCKNLVRLPTSIECLNSLKKLVLTNCSKLDWSSIQLCKMQSLKDFYAGGTGVNKAPHSMGENNLLGSLLWSLYPQPRNNPESINFSLASLSRSLERLSLVDCNLSNDVILSDLSNLSMLMEIMELDLSANPMSILPESIKDLPRLQSLELHDCEKLQSLPKLPNSVKSLVLLKCRSLEVITNLPNLLTSLDLLVFYCENLKTVGGLFQLLSIEECEAEMINIFKLVDVEFLRNVHVDLYNFLTLSRWRGPIKGLYECGIFSTSLLNFNMPSWCNYRSTRPQLCFDIPMISDHRIEGLNICAVYENCDLSSRDKNRFWNEPHIKIANTTKDLRWTYTPVIMGIPYSRDRSITWLTHWKLGDNLEAGDTLKISVSLFSDSRLKEFGVELVYEVIGDGTYPSCQHMINGVDISPYYVGRGCYFLCHGDFDVFQDNFTSGCWGDNSWYDLLFGDSELYADKDATTSDPMDL